MKRKQDSWRLRRNPLWGGMWLYIMDRGELYREAYVKHIIKSNVIDRWQWCREIVENFGFAAIHSRILLKMFSILRNSRQNEREADRRSNTSELFLMSEELNLLCKDKALLKIERVSGQQGAKSGGHRSLAACYIKSWPWTLKRFPFAFLSTSYTVVDCEHGSASLGQMAFETQKMC